MIWVKAHLLWKTSQSIFRFPTLGASCLANSSAVSINLPFPNFFVKKVGNLFGFLITPPPIFAKKYQRNDNECYNS